MLLGFRFTPTSQERYLLEKTSIYKSVFLIAKISLKQRQSEKDADHIENLLKGLTLLSKYVFQMGVNFAPKVKLSYAFTLFKLISESNFLFIPV